MSLMEKTEIRNSNKTDIFDRYIKGDDPRQRELASAWATGIGLQRVDGLSVSSFLIDVAIRNIEGEISMDEAQSLIEEHYK